MVDHNPGWARGGVWVSAWAVLALLAACGVQTPPAATSPESTEPAASSQPPPGGRASAPPPVPVPKVETPNPAGIRAPVASLASMEEHALAVRTYGAEEPSRCGLQAPGNANPPASVLVFFGCTPKDGPAIGAVPARVVTVPAGAKPERVAVETLLAGPTAEERRAGYASNFGDASRGIEAQVEIRGNGLAVVNFDRAILDQGRAFVSRLDARQVVATLGQFPGVERVLILIEGEPLCRALGEC